MKFYFADNVLDDELRELRRDGKTIASEPQVFDLLVYLLQNRDRVVTKDDVISAVWSGRVISESTLTSRINAARKAVGDSGQQQSVIRTFARKGFRIACEVQLQQLDSGKADSAGTGEQAAELNRRKPSLDRTAIAVLPFTNLSGESAQEYFSDGISEDIITALSKLRWFYVIARNSSFSYKGRPVRLDQIGEELGASYVLEGSVRKDGDQVRITAQLNDVATGSHLWAERYDRNLSDVFAVQDEITQAIVAAIEPQLYAAEDFRAQRKAPDNMVAWDLVMRALSHFWRVTRQDNIVAQALLEKAISVDQNYGQAYSLLAASHAFAAHMGWEDMGKAIAVAEPAALQAIRADSADAWAHNALACVYLFKRRFDDAIAKFELALQLNPNFSPARGYYGVALAYCGRWQEGDRAAREALRFSPRDPFAAIYCGVAAYSQYVGRNYEEAVSLSREAIRQRSDFVGGHRVLTAAAGMAGLTDLAREALQDLRRMQPNISLAWIESWMPFGLESERAHYLEGFRRAGLS